MAAAASLLSVCFAYCHLSDRTPQTQSLTQCAAALSLFCYRHHHCCCCCRCTLFPQVAADKQTLEKEIHLVKAPASLTAAAAATKDKKKEKLKVAVDQQQQQQVDAMQE